MRAYRDVSLLLIAIIRYVDTQIICISEQSYCNGGDVIMMVISTVPGAKRCLAASDRVYMCVCVW